ncbi:MAG: roadblock/LC7 domain-containing protein [Promethearchaeota archaeon]
MSDTPETLDVLLRKLLSTMPEVTAAAIVSVEGLPISSALAADVDETRIAAMTAAILSLAERAIHEMSKGDFQEIYIKGTDGYLIVLQAGRNAVLTVSTTIDIRLGLILLDAKRTCEKIAKLI